MWTEAKPIFQEVVAELQPQCILFVCKRVFHRVSQDFSHTNPLSIEENAIYKNPHPVLKIDLEIAKIAPAIASYINHPNCPRGGFHRARPVVKSLIETAGGKAWI
ncbi:hypothetical protein H6F89_19005 [Cyanobacteria bacterium FACHB-63]|nr:hypothetical protein [Cyanobacteria bacterium FACHB-63]